MIPLRLPATVEAEMPFVARLTDVGPHPQDATLVAGEGGHTTYASQRGLFAVEGATAEALDGDIVIVSPRSIERLIRPASMHNTLLVTEQCDQLCQMCSQPPKKTHEDRFELLTEACLIAPENMLIGITGGEPTLHKLKLLDMIESVLTERPDLQFHVLSNGQHFDEEDVGRLRSPEYKRVTWGIPLYSADARTHDGIVGKQGAFERLCASFARLLRAGARVELRTVVLTENALLLKPLAQFVAAHLRFIESWSIMQLENIGFASRRWGSLLFDHASNFAPVAQAIDTATLHGVRAQLFNFPLCTVPEEYRAFAVPSISDWKRKLVPACSSCRVSESCSGFFEWHPSADAERWARPL